MSKKSQPAPPDYSAIAAQQGAANAQAAHDSSILNNPNQVGPNGSQTWNTTPDSTGRYTVTQSLSPAEQQKLNLSDQAQTFSLNRLNEALPSLLQGLGGFNISGSNLKDFDPRLNPQQGYQLDTGIEQAPALQTSLNFGGAPALVSGDAARTNAQTAAYNDAARTLDPQWAQKEQETAANLANQGINPGSAAYKQAMDSLQQQKASAYAQARDQAQGQGLNAYNTMAGTSLAARQQSVGETQSQGQFANSSRSDAINQLLAAMGASNNALAQQYSTAQAGTQLNNAGRAADLNEQAQSMTLPVNILNSLLSSSQVNPSQFVGPSQNTQIQAAPLLQAAGMQQSANQTAANAGNAKGGQSMGLVGSLAGAAATAF